MTATYLVADVFDGLATIGDDSVDLVVTSPPFLALRSYLPADHPDKGKEIGRESSPAQFVDTLLAVTAELGRVLAPHGSICLELGDTYSGGARGADLREREPGMGGGPGWPLPKCMALVPEIYRFALAYGFNPLTGDPSPAGQWLIRNVVTWARPNPPVGALADKWRPGTSDLVVATRSPTRYWDDLATRRPTSLPASPRGRSMHDHSDDAHQGRSQPKPGSHAVANPDGAPLLDWWEIPDEDYWEASLFDDEEGRAMGSRPPRERKLGIHWKTDGQGRVGNNSFDAMQYSTGHPFGPPLLDWWELPPGGYEGAHYAVFPPGLVEPCVKAMTPPRVCQTCGEPSRRVVESRRYDANGETIYGDWNANNRGPAGYEGAMGARTTQSGKAIGTEFTDLGWSDCGHDDWRPGMVLDPFAGSGTTLLVATGHGHDAIGIDLDGRNYDQALDRVGPLMLAGDGNG